MKYGSLFTGVCGFDLGFDRAGMECAWQAEIDPTCRRVEARHYPNVARRDDIRTCGADNLAPVDVVCGGFPCQDLSVAGKRAGLAGGRSGLFYEMTRVCSELRPTYIVWENVPGLLSSESGRDFARVLIELERIGYCGAWSSLDAQWFGVAQRRRRVFGVFTQQHLGAARCAKILSFSRRLFGHSPSRQEAGQGVAGTLTGGTGGGSSHGKPNGSDRRELVAATLNAGGNAGGFRTEPGAHLVVPEVVLPLTYGHTTDHYDDTQQTYIPDVSYAITGNGSKFGSGRHNQDTFVAFALRGREDGAMVEMSGDAVSALRGSEGGSSRDYLYQESQYGTAQYDTAGTLRHGRLPHHQIVNGVRRLTPRECERLQGFPDDWTRYDADGKEIADSPRYRMLGNAVCVSVAEWIARRIVAVEAAS